MGIVSLVMAPSVVLEDTYYFEFALLLVTLEEIMRRDKQRQR